MKAKDLDKIIRETNACDNRAIAESLKANNPEVFDNKKERCINNSHKAKKRIAILVPIAAVVCLACILIPSILLTRKPNGNDGGPGDDFYYCYSEDYGILFTDKTLKDFSSEAENKILFFDWYDIGVDCATSLYKLNDSDTVICISESIYNIETEDFVELCVSPSEYILDKFIFLIDDRNNLTTIGGIKVKYCTDGDNSLGTFTYDSYTYYLTLYNTDMQRLFYLIDELLRTQN